MTRDKAVDTIMRRLGFRKDTARRQDIIDEMVYVQENIIEGHVEGLWFLASEATTTTNILNEERIALPTDFSLEMEDSQLRIVNADGSNSFLQRDDWDAILEAKGNGTGKPTHYDLVGDYIQVRPIPDIAYTFKFRYYKRDLTLTGAYGDGNNIENKCLEFASDWMINETGKLLAAPLGNQAALQLFVNDLAVAKKRVLDKNVAMQESNKQRFMEG